MKKYTSVMSAMAGTQHLVCGRNCHPPRFLALTGFLLILLAFAGCGFHLRGAGKIEFPALLSTLRVTVENSQQQNDPLLIEMKNALRTQTEVQIEDSSDVPSLVLYGENTESQVLSVGSTGKADEYLLKYQVSYRITDKEGKSLADAKTVRVQRDHVFDRLNVLAMEREEQELRREMQHDAVQQILRRLARTEPVLK
jgi:LPS-assembly lipoprotein